MTEIGTKVVDIIGVVSSPITSLISKVTGQTDMQGTTPSFLDTRPVLKAVVKGAEMGFYLGGTAAGAAATYGLPLNAIPFAGPAIYIGAIVAAALIGFIIGVAIKYKLDAMKEDLDAKTKADTDIKEKIGKIEAEMKTIRNNNSKHEIIGTYTEDMFKALNDKIPNAKTRLEKENLLKEVTSDLQKAVNAREEVLKEVKNIKAAKKQEKENFTQKFSTLLELNKKLLEKVENLEKKIEPNNSFNSGSSSTTSLNSSSKIVIN